DDLHLAGPKSTVVLPDEIDWVLLAGDETALPAIARFLEERPVPAPVRVVIELGDPAARQELSLRDGDTIEWVVTAPGEASRLADAVRALDWWPGGPYAW
ncbi:siderophore-interacting protein, partial [Leucobacter sp. M11]|uniref:siderophore-interacting protein n=1 Tax=Leucobacter sp. M11 TaxID=2993565 RepID=UPI002D7E9F67